MGWEQVQLLGGGSDRLSGVQASAVPQRVQQQLNGTRLSQALPVAGTVIAAGPLCMWFKEESREAAAVPHRLFVRISASCTYACLLYGAAGPLCVCCKGERCEAAAATHRLLMRFSASYIRVCSLHAVAAACRGFVGLSQPLPGC